MKSMFETGDKVLFPYDGELQFGWVLGHGSEVGDIYIGYLSNTEHVLVKASELIPSIETLARREGVEMPYDELYMEDGYGIKWRKFVYYVDSSRVMSGHFETASDSMVHVYGDMRGLVSVPPSHVFLPSSMQLM